MTEAKSTEGPSSSTLSTSEKRSDSAVKSTSSVADLKAADAPAVDHKSDSATKLALPRNVKLLPHERDLLERGLLRNITHENATSVWLEAASTEPGEGLTTVYRPMGDAEVLILVQNGQLPDTQPYQAIIEGPNGRVYAEKYLNGQKRVDTQPSAVVEFVCPKALIDKLFALQHKAEDGALSMGLGNKAGGGLPLFNASLKARETTWRIVKVKRTARERDRSGGDASNAGKSKPFGAGKGKAAGSAAAASAAKGAAKVGRKAKS